MVVFTTEKQKKFANEYLIDLNATRAYKKAYPNVKSDETAAVNASKLLRNTKVSEYIEKRMKEREKRTEITQDMVIRELAAIGFANGTDYARIVERTMKDKFGNLIMDGNTGEPIKDKVVDFVLTNELPDEKKKAIAGIKEGANGIEVKLNDKVKALELLGKHLGMFERLEEYKDALEKLDLILEGISNAAK